MCLLQTIIKNTFHLQQKVATRPIKVLKIGYFSYSGNYFLSQIYPKEYKKDEKYSFLLPKPYLGEIIVDDPSYLNCENAHIEEGFHSYRDIPTIYKRRIESWGWLTKDIDTMLPDVIAIFEIPEGSIYYSDGENHYVSDSIILRKVIFDLEEWRAESFQPEKVL